MTKPPRWRHVFRTPHGWHVAVRRKGKIVRRIFGNTANGGRAAALARAIQWRDSLLRFLAPATLIRKRYAPNTTGVIGVQLDRTRTRAGRISPRYTATWYEHGRQRTRGFSVAKYGMKRAKALATLVRRKAVSRILRERRRRLRGS